MARFNINTYNQRIDYTRTVERLGRNGVHYEYIIPLNAPDTFSDYYNNAIDVKSHKSPTTKYDNGKKPGQYQPVGDKSYFTYYQFKQMSQDEKNDWFVNLYAQLLKEYLNISC